MVKATRLASLGCFEGQRVLAGIADGELNTADSVPRAFVVDEGPWTKLTDGQEARPLEVVPIVLLRSACAGDVGGERESREAVARQERFGSEVAVAIEVALG